jgi:hypothetical protein
MTNKSVTYMLVAVLIGVTLITAVPDQIARYASPQQMLSMESSKADSISINESGSVELYWDSVGTPEENSTDDYEIWVEVVNLTDHGRPEGDTVVVTGKGFSGSQNETYDINEKMADLADQLSEVTEEFAEVQNSIADVSALAADAVAAAEAASEAVTAVAATANTASEAAADAAEAANASRDAASGLTTISMFAWYAFDALIAVGVYILAKRKFG